MCCKPDNCILTTEVLTGSANIPMPQTANDRLKGSTITSIATTRSGTNTLKTRMGYTVAADTVLATAHLMLKDANSKEFIDIPFWLIMRDYNNPEPLKVNLDNIDLTQSYIVLDTTASGYSATNAIQITFGFNCKTC